MDAQFSKLSLCKVIGDLAILVAAFSYIQQEALASDIPIDPDLATHAALRKKILAPDYDRFALPSGRGQSLPVVVQFGVSVIAFSVNEQKMTVDMQLWYRGTWKDHRLTWDPMDHGGINTLRIPTTEIWMPDITSYNEYPNEHAESSLKDLKGTTAILLSNGTILAVPKARVSAHCPLDYTLWPHDQHKCSLVFGSWTYDGLHIDLQSYGNGEVDLNYLNKKGGWELEILGKPVRKVTYYPCCSEPYITIDIGIRLSRAAGHFQYTLLTPLHLIAFLTLVSLWMPTNFKVFTAIGNALVLVVLLQYHFTHLPSMVQKAPIIASFASGMLLLQVATLIWTSALNCIAGTLLKLPSVKNSIKTARTGVFGFICCLRRNDGGTQGQREAILNSANEEMDEHHHQQSPQVGEPVKHSWHSETELIEETLRDALFLLRVLTFLMSCAYFLSIVSLYSVFWPVREIHHAGR